MILFEHQLDYSEHGYKNHDWCISFDHLETGTHPRVLYKDVKEQDAHRCLWRLQILHYIPFSSCSDTVVPYTYVDISIDMFNPLETGDCCDNTFIVLFSQPTNYYKNERKNSFFLGLSRILENPKDMYPRHYTIVCCPLLNICTIRKYRVMWLFYLNMFISKNNNSNY